MAESSGRDNIKNIYRMTSLQEGILYHSITDNLATPYIEQSRFHLASAIDPQLFEQAWNHIVERHDILRTLFVYEGVSQPRQVVLKSRKIYYKFLDLSNSDRSQQQVEEFLVEDQRTPFNLTRDPLVRVVLFKLESHSWEVVLTHHHIILDGWSIGIIFDEVQNTYTALKRGVQLRLPAPVQFEHYIRWLSKKPLSDSLTFWKERLQYVEQEVLPPGYHPALGGSADNYSTGGLSVQTQHRFSLGRELSQQLQSFVSQQHVTLNTLIQTVWAVMLQQVNRTQRVLFGATVSGRSPEIPNIEQMVGLFINAIPVRVDVDLQETFEVLLHKVQKEAFLASDHHHVSLADVQESSPLKGALINHILVFENYSNHGMLAEEEGDGEIVVDDFYHTDHTNYDLTLQIIPSDELEFNIIYNTRCFGNGSIEWICSTIRALLQQVVLQPRLLIKELELPTDTLPVTESVQNVSEAVISATFTAEPLLPHMQWWINTFELPQSIRFAPYNQIFQSLLDPNGAFASSSRGCNILLLRVADWIRELGEHNDAELIHHLRKTRERFITACSGYSFQVPLLITLLPGRLECSGAVNDALEHIEIELTEWLQSSSERQEPFQWIDLGGICSQYGVTELFDSRQDEAAHVPFTEPYYAAVATALSRQLVARQRPPFKVIAVDCDNTLWDGVCGESGALGVSVTTDHQALQRFLLERIEEGFLLVLNSKNREEDVWLVFEEHPEMLLSREQIVAARINWQSKSANLRELAQELNLGLDSFLFIDDSGVEVSEVMSRAPEVLALKLPTETAHFVPFLKQVWGFDRVEVTREDRVRSERYRQEQARKTLQQESLTMDAYLSGLGIKVWMEPVTAQRQPGEVQERFEERLSRMAQLIQRTNQFNLSTRRRSRGEVEQLLMQPDWHGWVLSVEDHFGEYGLVGVVLAHRQQQVLLIDTLLLSCRVLGRGVEFAVLTGIGTFCLDHGVEQLVLEYRQTERNQPVLDFLNKVALLDNPQQEQSSSHRYSIPVSSIEREISYIELYLESPLEAAKALSGVGGGQEEMGGGSAPEEYHRPNTAGQGEDRIERQPLPSSATRWEVYLEHEAELLHRAYYQPLIHYLADDLTGLVAENHVVTEFRHQVEYKPVAAGLQTEIAEIWREVLGDVQVGQQESFFEVGGHSLKAVRLVARLQRHFGVALSLADLFDLTSVAKQADWIEAHTGESAPNHNAIEPLPDAPHYALSHAQHRLWVLHQMERNSIAYNTSVLYEVEGALDVECWKAALSMIVKRHQSLRTLFISVEGEPRQVVKTEIVLPLQEITLAPSTAPQEEAALLGMELARTPFDLQQAPLFRVILMRADDNHFMIALTMHHIISDGWSMNVLHEETMHIYQALQRGESDGLQPLPIQYRDYAAWQSGRKADASQDRERHYWLNKLKGPLPVLELASDYRRPPVQTFNGQVFHYDLSAGIWSSLQQFGLQQQVTPFMLLNSLVKVLFYRHGCGEDIIIGTPVAGRPLSELEHQIGLYINTIALRDQISGVQRYSEFLQMVKQTTIEGFDHQLYPFDQLVDELEIERNASRSPLFDVMLVLQEGVQREERFGDLTISGVELDAAISRFDLVFNFREQESVVCTSEDETQLHCDLIFNTDLFSELQIEQLMARFTRLVEEVIEDPERVVGSIPLLPDTELEQLQALEQSNIVDSLSQTITDCFRQQVDRYRESIAVIEGGRHIEYGQLQQRIECIGSWLLTDAGVEQEEIVALIAERGEGLYAGIVAVMLAGGVVLPIDPGLPNERIAYMLRDSGCRTALLGEGVEQQRFSEMAADQQKRDAPDRLQRIGFTALNSLLDMESRQDPVWPDIQPQQLAYVIYTSGSTGQPKGVLLEHEGFVNMIQAQIREFQVTAQDRVLHFASPSFDASMSEIFMALLCGATLVPVSSRQKRNRETFCRHLEQNGVTIATLPPIYLHGLELKRLEILKTLITAGEAPDREDVSRLASRLNYFNAYGPTETSVCATLYLVPGDFATQASQQQGSQIPVGRPIDNLKLQLIDHQGKTPSLVPLGSVGEICVAGAGVARGYLNRSELTSARFCSDPALFNGERYYRTGDLGRWRGNGQLELLGRVDDQVKIRGNRVEPGEIEASLRSFEGIRDAVVLATDQFSKQMELIAFVVIAGEAGILQERIRPLLLKTLPEYMIPARWVQLQQIELTSNGKVDRNSLLQQAQSQLEAEQQSRTIREPGTPIEVHLVKAWQQVLGAKQVDLYDNFFELGGDSIKAIQIVSLLDRYDLDTADLFQHPVLVDLAKMLETKPMLEETLRGGESEFSSGMVMLTPIQHWFFETFSIDPHLFVHAETFHFQQRIDLRTLKQALEVLLRYHDMLRVCYRYDQGDDGNVVSSVKQEVQSQQLAAEMVERILTVDELSAENLDEEQIQHYIERRASQEQHSLDLSLGDLFKVVLFRLPDRDELLLLIHHLLVDAVSWRYLVEDLFTLLANGQATMEALLPPRGTSFRQWSEAIQDYATSDHLMAEREYWREIDTSTVQRLPKDHINGGTKMATRETLSVQLGEKETARLRNHPLRHQGYTVNDLLLTALGIALASLGRVNGKVAIAMEGHGRRTLGGTVRVNRTMGWFTSVFPVLLKVESGLTPEEVLMETHHHLQRVPDGGFGYSILRYLTSEERRPGLDFSLRPEISFNYLGEYRPDRGAEGALSTESGSRQVSLYPSERLEQLYELEFNLVIEADRLQLMLEYNTAQFETSTVEELLNQLLTALVVVSALSP